MKGDGGEGGRRGEAGSKRHLVASRGELKPKLGHDEHMARASGIGEGNNLRSRGKRACTRHQRQQHTHTRGRHVGFLQVSGLQRNFKFDFVFTIVREAAIKED